MFEIHKVKLSMNRTMYLLKGFTDVTYALDQSEIEQLKKVINDLVFD
jgi:hypothetical protein